MVGRLFSCFLLGLKGLFAGGKLAVSFREFKKKTLLNNSRDIKIETPTPLQLNGANVFFFRESGALLNLLCLPTTSPSPLGCHRCHRTQSEDINATTSTMEGPGLDLAGIMARRHDGTTALQSTLSAIFRVWCVIR